VLQHITYNIIRRAIFCLWFAVLVLVCLPFAGFGRYYDSGCVRYRDATATIDIAYAYLFFVFGKRTFKWNIMVVLYNYIAVPAV